MYSCQLSQALTRFTKNHRERRNSSEACVVIERIRSRLSHLSCGPCNWSRLEARMLEQLDNLYVRACVGACGKF